MSAILNAICDGQITPAEGEMMANIVTAQTNLFQAEELESRLKKMEDLATKEQAKK
jgi:hypothetical protein